MTIDNPVELERVACEICLREVPVSEAIIPEAVDYVIHFCGVDCFETWKRSNASVTPRSSSLGSDMSGQAPG
jgi:hypothetical protein